MGVAALIFVLVAAAAPPELGDVPFTLEAERLIVLDGGLRFQAEGSVVLKRAGSTVQADRISFDRVAQTGLAEGNVTVAERNSVLTCSRVTLALPELIGNLRNVELRIKGDVPEAIFRTLTPQELRTYGRNQAILKAESLERIDKRKFDVFEGSFTPCDCGENVTPSWRIEADQASVDLDSGVWLDVPVFYAHNLPIFILPKFYVPLGERRSGLLLPRLGPSPASRPLIVQPLYLTLGRSWDTTIEAGWYFGRGLLAGLELRWAPETNTWGEARASLIVDKPADLPRVERWAFTGKHQSRFDDSQVVSSMELLHDPLYLVEFGHDFHVRQTEDVRSRITYGGIGASTRWSTSVMLLQDLRLTRYLPLPAGTEFRSLSLLSGEGAAGRVRQRLLEARVDAAPPPLAIGSHLSLLGDARFSTQFFVAPNPSLPRFVRADLRPGAIVPINLELATLELSAHLRMTGWSGHAAEGGRSSGRLAPVLQAALTTDVRRDAATWFHSIRPTATYKLIPKRWQDGAELYANGDEIDVLEPVHQWRTELATEWGLRDGGAGGGIRGWIGEDLRRADGTPGRGLSEAVFEARGDVRIFGLGVGANGFVSAHPKDGLREAFGGGQLRWRRDDMLSVGYGVFTDDVPTHSMIAAEELVPSGAIDPSRYVALDEYGRRLAAGDLDVLPWAPWRGLTTMLAIRPFAPLRLGFEAVFTFDEPVGADGSRPSVLRNSRTFVSYQSACRCWGLSVSMTTARDLDVPDIQVAFDLAQLGSVTNQ